MNDTDNIKMLDPIKSIIKSSTFKLGFILIIILTSMAIFVRYFVGDLSTNAQDINQEEIPYTIIDCVHCLYVIPESTRSDRFDKAIEDISKQYNITDIKETNDVWDSAPLTMRLFVFIEKKEEL